MGQTIAKPSSSISEYLLTVSENIRDANVIGFSLSSLNI